MSKGGVMRHIHRETIATMAAVLGALAWASGARADSGAAAFDRGMQPVLVNYLIIHDSLARDSVEGIAAAANALAQAAAQLDPSTVSGEHAAHYKDVPANLQRSAETVAKARDIAAAREAFKQLSQPMAMWATMARPDGVNVLFCSMAKASWVQKHGEVRNPYYGAASLHCGEALASSGQPAAMHHGDHAADQHMH